MTAPVRSVPAFLDLIDAQHARVYDMLGAVDNAVLWTRPAPGKWCIGEILDHTRAVDRSIRLLMTAATPLLSPLARMRRGRPFEADIDDVFARPQFPSGLGRLWPPRHAPASQLPLARVQAETAAEHARMRRWYEARDEALLGHITIYDPAVGWVNGVQFLRIAAHHDAHHFRAIARMLGRDWSV